MLRRKRGDVEFGEKFWLAVLCPVLLVVGAVLFIILFLMIVLS